LGITHLVATAYQVAVQPRKQSKDREAPAHWGGIALLDIALGHDDYFYTLRGSPMTQEHPITPPPELLSRWEEDWHYAKVKHIELEDHIAHQAARWGADQELEACCEWFVGDWTDIETADKLRAARRPKPPSLKEQALQALAHLENGAHCSMDTTESAHYIRRALESLPD
jgi:hypothetical protein